MYDKEKKALKQAKWAHETLHRGERLLYHRRRRHMGDNEEQYLSLIFDGMQQNHCELPHLGNYLEIYSRPSSHLLALICFSKRMSSNLTKDSRSTSKRLRCMEKGNSPTFTPLIIMLVVRA